MIFKPFELCEFICGKINKTPQNNETFFEIFSTKQKKSVCGNKTNNVLMKCMHIHIRIESQKQ